MSNHHTPDAPRRFYPPPPPPPPEVADAGEDVGLATEMVFSGQRRRQPRNLAEYERLQTGELQHGDEGDLYDDVTARDTPLEKPLRQQEDPSRERFALTTLILISLVGLGVLTILALLILRVLIG